MVVTLYSCMYMGCSKNYSTLRSLKKHVLSIHLLNFQSQCPDCFRWFANESSLGRHRLKHKNRNTFHCNICGKRFSDHSSLTYHMRIHGIAVEKEALFSTSNTLQESFAIRCKEEDVHNLWPNYYQKVELPPLRLLASSKKD